MKPISARRDSRPRLSSKGTSGSLPSALSRVVAVIKATLQEIFDESAYQRFLNRSGLQSSCGAYAIFRQENEQDRSRRPRCC